MSTSNAAAAKKISKAQEKAKDLRDSIWPDIDVQMLWNRKAVSGYTTIPRTMPLVMNIIDALTKNKPAGSAYFVMWCRTFDHSLLVIDNPSTLAVEAGFSGERAMSTWRDRMKSLVELGFIDAKEGPSGPYHYVLLFNPHKVVWNLKDRIQENTFRDLRTRAIEIGAKDMQPPVQPEPDAEQEA